MYIYYIYYAQVVLSITRKSSISNYTDFELNFLKNMQFHRTTRKCVLNIFNNTCRRTFSSKQVMKILVFSVEQMWLQYHYFYLCFCENIMILKVLPIRLLSEALFQSLLDWSKNLPIYRLDKSVLFK